MRAKDFIPASKPRNPVVRQQQTSGAGAHRDKKKEQKQGYEKHKGQGVAEARKVKGGDYQLKLVDRQYVDDTDLDDVVVDYYFDVYQNGQKVGHAQGDSYYGELVVKTDFNREFKLDTYHDKDHPLIQQFEKIQQQGVAEGMEEQVYKVVAVDKSNALKKPTKLNVKASSIEDVFSRLAANDWYALSINGVEVIAGKRLKQGVAEGESALEKFRKAAAEREKKHDEIEAKRKAAAKQGKENMSGAIDRLEKHLNNK